ncbi:FMN-binding negative transcriptional regulator [Roseateles amylovorans]|jgi:transcriptional regulator|uniref:FMN-binding negative transcriptional regulator n=1 Tax=Roseateles amylovorans TaxID=2978473 RepID=A0ABY6B3X5_9BURK|nr:FMN-binding negative transcriptional regulator [Roseateles amylovorans]UXH80073.1 FMN-binding negative transcriptional regulator [Roseateles amylovorans]
MYTPKQFDVPDLSMARLLIDQHPLATLILKDPTHGLSATPVPMIWGAEKTGNGWWLEGHLARANPHVAALSSADAGEVLVQFSGPGAYVSPRHYDSPMAVPTWNYLTLQVHGRVQILDHPLDKDNLLKRLIATQEPAYAKQWSGLPADFQGKLLGAIVGFRVPVERSKLKVKLSQNRTPGERERIMAHQREGTHDEQLLARWMSVLQR